MSDETEFDMAGALDDISADLFQADPEGKEPTEPAESAAPAEPTEPAESAAPAEPTEPAAPTVRTPPASWKKEMHEKFAALSPDVQEYIEARENQMRDGLEKDRGDAKLGRTMRDVMTPYREMLQQQGVDEPRAVQYLLNAHYKLTTASPQEKQQYFATLAQQYGIDLGSVAAPADAPVDPMLRQLQQELNGIKSHLTAGQEAAFREAKDRVTREVEAFATDPQHPHFDDVATEVVAFLQAGHDLKAAYDKAVWANPVTRAKEVARLQQEAEAAVQAKSAAAAQAAQAATSNTVRNRDTRRTPTEAPRGSMRDLDSSLRDTLREIKQRAH